MNPIALKSHSFRGFLLILALGIVGTGSLTLYSPAASGKDTANNPTASKKEAATKKAAANKKSQISPALTQRNNDLKRLLASQRSAQASPATLSEASWRHFARLHPRNRYLPLKFRQRKTTTQIRSEIRQLRDYHSAWVALHKSRGRPEKATEIAYLRGKIADNKHRLELINYLASRSHQVGSLKRFLERQQRRLTSRRNKLGLSAPKVTRKRGSRLNICRVTDLGITSCVSSYDMLSTIIDPSTFDAAVPNELLFHFDGALSDPRTKAQSPDTIVSCSHGAVGAVSLGGAREPSPGQAEALVAACGSNLRAQLGATGQESTTEPGRNGSYASKVSRTVSSVEELLDNCGSNSANSGLADPGLGGGMVAGANLEQAPEDCGLGCMVGYVIAYTASANAGTPYGVPENELAKDCEAAHAKGCLCSDIACRSKPAEDNQAGKEQGPEPATETETDDGQCVESSSKQCTESEENEKEDDNGTTITGPEGDSCAAARAGWKYFKSQCEASGWQAGNCMAYVAAVNTCGDPRVVRPAPHGDLICAAPEDDGESDEQSYKRHCEAQSALTMPDPDNGRPPCQWLALSRNAHFDICNDPRARPGPNQGCSLGEPQADPSGTAPRPPGPLAKFHRPSGTVLIDGKVRVFPGRRTTGGLEDLQCNTANGPCISGKNSSR